MIDNVWSVIKPSGAVCVCVCACVCEREREREREREQTPKVASFCSFYKQPQSKQTGTLR